MNRIIKGAEPFFYPGGEHGCLLIHGFTGTPFEMHDLGVHLAGAGFSVLGVRLFGHATSIEDLQRARWEDWLTCVEDGLHLLRTTCRTVTVIGLSMGGTLALLSGAAFRVDGVVAMSALHSMPSDPRLHVLGPLSRLIPAVKKGPPDWQDQQALAEHIAYAEYPTRGILQLRLLVGETATRLPEIEVPVLLIHARRDTGVVAENAERIFAALRCEKELIWLEHSGHVITRDSERQQVFEAAAAFAARVGGAG